MTKKHLAVVSSNELEAALNNPTKINELFGFQGKPKPVIPFLRVEGADDEEGVVKAPKGSFAYDDGSRILYASKVKIRSFVKVYQYKLFDGKDASKTDSSIISPTFRAEFISASGRIACGKVNKKVFEQLGPNASPEQQYFQEKVKCKLIVFGLVSGAFTDVDTKEKVTVEDQLFSWTVSQSGFISIDQTITGIEKERRAVPLTNIELSLKKEKNGSVTYYVPIAVVSPESSKFDIERDSNYLKKIQEYISDTNRYVTDKYNEAVKARTQDVDFANVGEIVEGKVTVLKQDTFNDPLDL